MMVDISQIGGLLGVTNSTNSNAAGQVATLLEQNKDLAAVTQSLLSSKIESNQPIDSVTFSQELQNYINENVEGPKAEKLLADIAALENLSQNESINSDPVGQLIGANSGKNSNEAGNILDLLV
jgi:hypothetical protein